MSFESAFQGKLFYNYKRIMRREEAHGSAFSIVNLFTSHAEGDDLWWSLWTWGKKLSWYPQLQKALLSNQVFKTAVPAMLVYSPSAANTP